MVNIVKCLTILDFLKVLTKENQKKLFGTESKLKKIVQLPLANMMQTPKVFHPGPGSSQFFMAVSIFRSEG